MEKAGVARSVVSIDDYSLVDGDYLIRSRLTRSCNEYLASLAADYPQRFVPLATLPLPDVDSALREFEYAIGMLRHAGLCLMSNTRGVYLGSDGQEELFAECEKRRIPIMIHPSVPPVGVLDPRLEYTHDVTRAVANLMYRGVLERYPDLTLVFAQAGGTLSYIRDRVLAVGLESYIERKAIVPLLLRYRRRRTSLRRAYLELSGATNRFAIATIKGTVDPSRMLYGSGFPYCTVAEAVEAQGQIDADRSTENGKRLFAATMGFTKIRTREEEK
jgi:predicted TIM-barrel fold metal-dependent hydrolase